MKKKIIFSLYNLDIGGIETSLINLLNIIDYNKYEVTLLVEKYEGLFIDRLPKNIVIELFPLCENKNKFYKRIANRFNLYKWILKNKNKYDFSGAYVTYSTRTVNLMSYASRNSAYWIHGNYYSLYKGNIKKIKTFFKNKKLKSFKRLIFVSNESKDSFLNIYTKYAAKSLVINNILDYKKIINMSNQNINFVRPNGKIISYVGRLSEEEKRISLLLKSFKNVYKVNNSFLYIIGDGPDKKNYEDYVKKNELSERVFFLGKLSNPYPYIKASDLVMLTSISEGFPVVILECLLLNTKIASTVSVSDKYFRASDYIYLINEKNIEQFLLNIDNMDNKKAFDIECYYDNIKQDLFNLLEGKI